MLQSDRLVYIMKIQSVISTTTEAAWVSIKKSYRLLSIALY